MPLSGSLAKSRPMPKRRRTKNKPDPTGRKDTSRFVRLDYRMLSSNAYRSLAPSERTLLIELSMLFNGKNNGSLYLSVRDAAHRMGLADTNAAMSAFDRLQSLGFIDLTQDAHFQVKAADKSRARCWRLTWLPGPGRKGPSHDYWDREPEPQTLERKRMERGQKALKRFRKARESNKFPVLESETVDAFPPVAVLDFKTRNSENGGFPTKHIVLDSTTHIAAPMGDGAFIVSGRAAGSPSAQGPRNCM